MTQLLKREYMIAASVVACAIVVTTAWTTYPWTKYQCYRWVAERSTKAAMIFAEELCEQKFGPLKVPLKPT